MLAERFIEVEQERQRTQAARSAARLQRDNFVAARMPAITAAHADAAARVCGAHPLLAVQRTTASQSFPTRTFGSLNLTTTTVRSTLYGPPETVTFAPDLEFLERDQFGVIRIRFEAAREPALPEPLAAIVRRGLVVRGATTAEVVFPQGTGFATLTDAMLELLLCALLIRR